ncbi:hypothetical protein H2O64_19615 [Kordia sp. YSTF-M3]|uniref:Uncharacterized protein n=1 Tax=Kordia aestuariivivens TaxID=2759037 RepID=A0ABR7QEU6_9FLAO|nr:hypothetical protein [Kordia aestuariivivens]MBC8756891.1 hypothetical protein [Kordia aestuariivivens]
MGLNFEKVFISNKETTCCMLLLLEKNKRQRIDYTPKKDIISSTLWEVKLLFGCIEIYNLIEVINREK